MCGGWRSRSFGTRARVFRRKRFNLPRASFGPTNRDFERTLSGRQLVSLDDLPSGFQIEPSGCRRSPHAPSARPWLRSTSRCVSQPSRDFPRASAAIARAIPPRTSPFRRDFRAAHLSRPLRSDTRSPRARRTPPRAGSPRTCRTPRRNPSRWWTPRCSRRSRSCARSARKPRRPARQRYDSSRDRDTAAMVFLSALASTWATTPAVSVPTRVTRTARRGERAMRSNRPAFTTPRRLRRDARVPGARARRPPRGPLSPRSRSRPRARSRRVSQRFGFFTRVIRKKRLFRRDLFRDASLPSPRGSKLDASEAASVDGRWMFSTTFVDRY